MPKYLPFLIGAIVLVALAAGISAFSSWQESKEVAWIESLKDRHPQGEQFVAALLAARSELKDDDKDNDFSAQLRMGVNLNLLGEKEQALEWYEKALETDATNILALNNMANIYTDLGQYEKAEETWLKLIAAYPDRASFYRSLGFLYRFQMKKSAAEIEAFFKQGLEVTNNDPDLITWLLAYFEETGNNEKWVEYANLLAQQNQE